MSIHQRRIFGPRPQFTHNTVDSRKRRHHAPLIQRPFHPFWATIVGTPTEQALARLMQGRVS